MGKDRTWNELQEIGTDRTLEELQEEGKIKGHWENCKRWRNIKVLARDGWIRIFQRGVKKAEEE